MRIWIIVIVAAGFLAAGIGAMLPGITAAPPQFADRDYRVSYDFTGKFGPMIDSYDLLDLFDTSRTVLQASILATGRNEDRSAYILQLLPKESSFSAMPDNFIQEGDWKTVTISKASWPKTMFRMSVAMTTNKGDYALDFVVQSTPDGIAFMDHETCSDPSIGNAIIMNPEELEAGDCVKPARWTCKDLDLDAGWMGLAGAGPDGVSYCIAKPKTGRGDLIFSAYTVSNDSLASVYVDYTCAAIHDAIFMRETVAISNRHHLCLGFRRGGLFTPQQPIDVRAYRFTYFDKAEH